MIKYGIATFSLDEGKCPPWLFERMTRLGKQIIKIICEEYGPDEFIERISNPAWFQTLGTVLAFDWNASGLTTVLTAALKEAIRGQEKELGIFICGGKGKTSLKTPEEIQNWGTIIGFQESKVKSLVHNSKISAKVDNALIQDGFQLYHHAFFFSKNGVWAVIQQGMNTAIKSARRYHWYSKKIENIIVEPHYGITCKKILPHVLNLTSKNSEDNRKISLELIDSGYKSIMKEINILRKYKTSYSKMLSLSYQQKEFFFLKLENIEFKTHPVLNEDLSRSKYLEKIISKVTYIKPKSYEEFLSIEGVGPKTVRALSLIAEIIYGAKPSYEDPARYSFAFGGKDGTPYPIDRKTYDETLSILENAIRKSNLSPKEKTECLFRLYK
jgi:hypothetical protein